VVVDAFYVTDVEGRPIGVADRPRLESQLHEAWPA
jgi:hypothetical protein